MLTHGLHGSHAVIILWTSMFMVMLYTNIDMHAQQPPMVVRVSSRDYGDSGGTDATAGTDADTNTASVRGPLR